MMIIRVLGNLIIFATFMLANVQLHVDDEFIAGDAVTFSIKAQGEDIEFPPISTIENFDVHKNGSSNNITIINGKRSEHRVQSYKFFPNKSVLIPAFKIMIDGQEVFTKEHNITQKKIQKTKSNKFDLKIEVNKSKAFVGEDVKLVLRFKYAKNANILDLGFNNPVFENFWSKQYGKPKKYQKNGFIVQELTYLLFPQKKGLLKINPVKIDMILSDPKDPYSFLGQGINKRLYSNDLQLEVDALPDDVALIGKFKLKSKVNKRTLKSGEATAYSITVEGRGNIDDLDDVKLDIPNVTIYENKAEQKYNVDTNGNYGGVYTKSFSIVAQDDFVIPSIEISYLDKKSK
ncbi:MAG: BatD family protein, partial [Campylobacterota bacterium]|nr:BatD family protein [Campylobacterota bacterium]